MGARLSSMVTGLGTWPTRVLNFSGHRDATVNPSVEFLITNGLGGYASGLVSGGIARRYHGLLVAAEPPPIGRVVCVSAIRTYLVIGERRIALDHEDVGVIEKAATDALAEFRLEAGMPVWRYVVDNVMVEKRVFMPYRQNVTCLMFDVPQPTGSGENLAIECEPVVNPRLLEDTPDRGVGPPVDVAIDGTHATLRYGSVVEHVHFTGVGEGVAWSASGMAPCTLDFGAERQRGYQCSGTLWIPCRVTLPLKSRHAGLVLSTGPIEAEPVLETWVEAERKRRVDLLNMAAFDDEFEAELILAADQFLIKPVGHDAGAASAPRPDESLRTVIAGYHWFTDWGRDTMISLDGLTLATGRTREARAIIALFVRHVRDGLIPNLFPEGQHLGLYHTADATLWLFEAIGRYATQTGDRDFVRSVLPMLGDIIEWHRRGTAFGIGVDPADGLLRQGQPGYALTWMDAKMGDWVVTPRRGKAVEINALWYNALCWMTRWNDDIHADLANHYQRDALRVRESFNLRFWNEERGFLFDVVDGDDGDDPSCRPNQVFAISLPHPVLERARWATVMEVIHEKLLTPVGLRTLAPDEPAYRSQYLGDLKERDGAYHQGTVWPWLMGAYVDALLKTAPGAAAQAREALSAFPAQLSAFGIGSIGEICDADSPHLFRGCIAQAWSVAEVLRAWKKSKAPA